MKIFMVFSLLVFSCRVADATELTGAWQLKYTEVANRKHFVTNMVIFLWIGDSKWTSISTTTNPADSVFRLLYALELHARLATDDTKRPRQIDLFVTSGTPGTVGTAWKGIYEIQGNTLKICRTTLTSRPTRFFSSSDGKVILEVYELPDS